MAKSKVVAPFVKWAGGKRQLIADIKELLPNRVGRLRYVEPFIGGGALFFHLQPRRAIINDFNAELVNVYRTIRDNPTELIADLKTHINDRVYFNELRARDREEVFADLSRVSRASRFIYLNKTCYNGLYRVNKSGYFNTPFGSYKNPKIVDEKVIMAVSRYLNKNEIEICNGDYAAVLEGLDRNCFVYIDPPYDPLTQTASFTGYVEGGWDRTQQVRLRQMCDELHRRRIKFLLSNSATDFIREQYGAYEIVSVNATRNVNANAEGRGAIEEFLIRNYG